MAERVKHAHRHYSVYYVIRRYQYTSGRDTFRWSFHIPSPIKHRNEPNKHIEVWWPQKFYSIADAVRSIEFFQECVARAVIGGPQPRAKPGDRPW